MEQIFFTKEITLCNNHYDPMKRWVPPKRIISYDKNTQNARYCPRRDEKHKHNCELVQMIVEFNTQHICSDTICTLTFVDNIKIPLWNRCIETETGRIVSKCGWGDKHMTKEEIEKFYNEQVIPIETSLYKYNDNVITTNFNIKLFADSFADDELESFRSNVEKFVKIFGNMNISRHISEIKYILLTEYKNVYVQKKEFLEKHKPNLYEKIISSVTQNLGNINSRVIVFNNLSSKSNFVPTAVVTKLITLYLDFLINPLFEMSNFGEQKPNPHISKKKKQH
jgi:hypothetical protein